MNTQTKTFWTDPSVVRYERIIRESVVHVGKEKAYYIGMVGFFSTYNEGTGYIVMSHENVDILMCPKDDIIRLNVWPKGPNDDGTFHVEETETRKLSDFVLLLEFSHYIISNTPKQEKNNESNI